MERFRKVSTQDPRAYVKKCCCWLLSPNQLHEQAEPEKLHLQDIKGILFHQQHRHLHAEEFLPSRRVWRNCWTHFCKRIEELLEGATNSFYTDRNKTEKFEFKLISAWRNFHNLAFRFRSVNGCIFLRICVPRLPNETWKKLHHVAAVVSFYSLNFV